MRYITPSTFQSTNSTIVTNDTTHHSNKLSPKSDGGGGATTTTANSVVDSDQNSTSTTTTTTAAAQSITFREFIHGPRFQRSISIMIVLSLLLPLVGVYCIIMFHPWIDWMVEGALWSKEHAPFVDVISMSSGYDGAFDNVSLVENDDSLQLSTLSMKEKWKQEREEEENGQCLSLSSFVEHGRRDVTPRRSDEIKIDDHGIIDEDDKDGVVIDEEDFTTFVSNERMPREHDVSTFNDTDDTSSNDFICVNCHALFRIHVDILFQGQEVDPSTMMDDATTNPKEEERKWFVTLRDVTHENVPLLYAHMDRPLDLDCDPSTTVHRDNTAHFSRCQSTTIIEVPYTSFSSTTSGYNSTNYHEVVMMNERIILVSLQREWSSSRFDDDSLKDIMVNKKERKRRIVDQWMINIIVPSKDGVGGRGLMHSSSIHSAKLRDVVKSDTDVSTDTTRTELESSFVESPATSSLYMYEVFVAVVVAVVVAVAILALAFKFVVPRGDEEEEEEEEEEIMTTSEILALQRAIRNSNSSAASHDNDEEEVESAIQYESSQGRRSRTEEQLEIDSAREQSTPTNLSPLFDDEADTEEVTSNHDGDEVNEVVEDSIQEESEESFGEDNGSCGESEVEGSVQDPFQEHEHEHDLDEDETATEMIGEDEDTPPTSNKSNKWSVIPRRNSLDNVDDIIREEKDECTAIGSPLFYSPRFQSSETAPLPHSNTSSVYDSVELADDTDSNPTMSVEPASILLSKPAESNHPSIECRAEWNEFGAFVQDRDMFNAEDVDSTDDNEALVKCADAAESSMNKDEEDPSLSGVSKRLFTTSKPNTDEVEKASSFREEFDEVDESMFLPNVIVQAEANASPLNLQERRSVPVEATESNAMNTLDASLGNEPTATCGELVGLAEAGKQPLVEPLCDSQQNANLLLASPEKSVAANASATCNKSLPVSSPSKEANSARKTVNTPLTAPMSSCGEENSPISHAAASSTKTSIEKSVAKCDANEASTSTTDTVESGNLGKTDLAFAAPQFSPSPSPNRSQHDLSYVNQSLSVSSSPSVTSPPRNSNSPSVTSDPRFSPGEWSNDEARVRKRRSLPFVSREDTSRAGKENASSNSRTPLSAKATNYSPSSTVAATVAEFVVPRAHNGRAWRAERPVPVPSGSGGQNKRLGGSPAHFEPRASSTEVEESNNDDPIDFSSQNDDSERNGSSRSGKRSRASKGNKSRKSRKRKSNVEKKLLATTKTSDKHKPPSGLSSLSQRLNEEMWQHSQTSDKCYDL